ncbi:MAG TPA: head decoration protein [Bacteroidales bacterium]|nr:head decoration protein [Bacteroidales bacterium]
MSIKVPHVIQDKNFVSKKVFLNSYDHPILVSGQILATETFPFLAGTVVAKQTSTGKIVRYVDGEDDGKGTAVGILGEQVDAQAVGATPLDVAIDYAIHGVAYESACVGLDANGKVDLAGQIIFI